MKDWERDKQWSDQFLPEIKRIVGSYLVQEASVEEDRSCNTDLIVLRAGDIRIGCRVRRYAEFSKPGYREQFTVRFERPRRVTEYAKIMDGWGDYFFYGFAGPSNASLCFWSLCDLDVFRRVVQDQMRLNGGHVPYKYKKSNHDGSSSFCVFQFWTFPKSFVLKRSSAT